VATEKFEQTIAVRNAQIGFLDHRRSDRRTVQKQGPVALFDPETDVGKLAVDFADLVYNGKWFTTLRECLQAFAVKTQEHVTGQVKLKLYKGNIITASVTSPKTLYSENLVTFEESDYDQKDSQGFINLWGLPDTVQALREHGKL